ncbi:MAG: hypothetical protein LUG85_02315 [Clostridiales bacterium]|nr:hypothetical protein [Clostridiales bacterium]MCD7827357.1 hypothetical protein [Clostridiales bacterium]
MRKSLTIALTLILSLTALCSCSSETETVQSENTTAAAAADEITVQSADINLCDMTFNMLYAQVNEMKASPEDYLNKTVAVTGTFQTSYYDETGKDYYYVIGSDVTSCCNWNLEFILEDGLSYPESGTEIQLTGVYSTYDELGVTYYYLDATSITAV